MPSRFREVAKAVLKVTIAVALLLVVFRAAGFALGQSVTLCLLVLVAYDYYSGVRRAATTESPASPYRVVVAPKLDKLLLDYKLVSSEDDLRALHDLWKKKDQRTIAFTVLKSRANGEDLVFCETDHYFTSKIEFEEPIEALCFRDRFDKAFDKDSRSAVYLQDPTVKVDLLRRPIPPYIFIRLGSGGYDVGLEVREDWWKQVCASDPNSQISRTPVDYNHITGSAYLLLAKIPHAAFAWFYSASNDWHEYEAISNNTKAELAKTNWKMREQDPHADIHDPWTRIEHEYFVVQYVSI